MCTVCTVKKDDRIEAVIKEFRLNDVRDMIAGDLPGGYKQRLSMAAALMHEPKILFLDEPTSGIDPLTRRNFWRQITSLSKRGTTIIITTHFMDESEYCDRIMIQDAGNSLYWEHLMKLDGLPAMRIVLWMKRLSPSY